MPTPFSSSFEEQTSIFAYAHTVCYEPIGGTAVINVNYRNNLNLPTSLTWQLTGLPIGDAEWQLFDRWSDFQTGSEYDYESAGAPITVQTTGFVVGTSGTYQVESSLHLHKIQGLQKLSVAKLAPALAPAPVAPGYQN